MQIKVTAINLKVTVEDFLLFSSPWECVPLAIFYHLSFLRISKVWSMVHHGSVGWVQKFRIKNASWCVHIIFWHVFAVFHQKNCFYHFFFFFFWWSIKFRQQNSNHSETRIGEKKLPVEQDVHEDQLTN